MKLLSFEIASKASFGVIVQDGVMELAGRLGSEVHSVQSLFESQELGMVQELIEHSEPDHSLDAIEFLPPVPTPQKIFCVGVNYTNRNEEYRMNQPFQSTQAFLCGRLVHSLGTAVPSFVRRNPTS